MSMDASFRHAVQEVAPAVRGLSDRELKAFGVAIMAELARREGCTMAASWAQTQADRLAALDGVTA